jgi:hypothetical protein
MNRLYWLAVLALITGVSAVVADFIPYYRGFVIGAAIGLGNVLGYIEGSKK